MPNWYMGNVNFTGEKDRLIKLYNDIEEQIQWVKDNKYMYLGLYHLFEKNGFDCEKYNAYWSYGPYNLCDRKNFRGTIYDPYMVSDNHLNCIFEIAWYMDYDMLLLLSDMYGVKFSAYGNEPNMGIYDRCENNNTNYYAGYDYALTSYYEDLEEKGLPLEYELFEGSESDVKEIMETLDKNDIQYYCEEIVVIDPANLSYHGAYYDLIKGVTYE